MPQHVLARGQDLSQRGVGQEVAVGDHQQALPQKRSQPLREGLLPGTDPRTAGSHHRTDPHAAKPPPEPGETPRPLPTRRATTAIAELCEHLTATETRYPGTYLEPRIHHDAMSGVLKADKWVDFGVRLGCANLRLRGCRLLGDSYLFKTITMTRTRTQMSPDPIKTPQSPVVQG
jgi:hypothetical protein